MKVSSTPQARHSNVSLGCVFLVTLHTIINLSLLNSTLKTYSSIFYKTENNIPQENSMLRKDAKETFHKCIYIGLLNA